jgi:ribosomal protein S6--L-glutamate ligase
VALGTFSLYNLIAVKIGILSFQPASKRAMHEELRLLQEVRKMGYIGRIFRSSKCQLVYDRHHARVLYDGKRFPTYDVIIPRVRLLTEVELRSAVVKQLQLMNIPVQNSYSAIIRAKNKLRTMQILDYHGIPTPKTVLIHGEDHIDEAIKKVGGPPVILKTVAGSHGVGVIIAETKRAAQSAISALLSNSWSNLILIQEYIKEARGKDTRVFVINGKVFGAMMRSAKKGEFRSNLKLGGSATPVSLTDEEKNIALRSVRALKLQVAGVDLLATNRGPAVMEVNANPGFEGFEEVTGMNVAQEMVKAAVTQARRYKALMRRRGQNQDALKSMLTPLRAS